MKHFTPNPSLESSNNKRPGIPPSHPHFPPMPPYWQIPSASIRHPSPPAIRSQNSNPPPTHSRSLSQPSFFSLDSLPPLSPSPCRDSTTSISDPTMTSSVDASMDDRSSGGLHTPLPPPPTPRTGGPTSRAPDSLPPRKHQRSHSEISFGFAAALLGDHPRNSDQSKPSMIIKKEADWDGDRNCNVEGMGERKLEGGGGGDVAGDDLFNAYMNLDNMEALNSGGVSDKDLDSRASGTKTCDSSENEVESSSANEIGSGERKEGNKRSAGGDVCSSVGAARHCRSMSMDSFIGKMQGFGVGGAESPKMEVLTGDRMGQHSRSNSMDGNSNSFSLEFGNGEFSPAEMKKIMANEKLAEIAMSDPKRAKRILANRQSAARSKERKMRYISELEHKVQTLQTEATTLSAQLTLLQRDSVGLTSQNNELRFRLQAMEQQAQLRDALNEALTAEVQRLKLATAELSESHSSNGLNQHLAMNPQMFSLQHQQQMQQLSIYQQQQQQQQQQQHQQNNSAANHDSNQ